MRLWLAAWFVLHFCWMGGLTWLGHDAVGGHLASLAWGDGHYHVILEHPGESASFERHVIPRVSARNDGEPGHVLHPFAADHFLRAGEKRPSAAPFLLPTAASTELLASARGEGAAAIALLTLEPTAVSAGLRSTILLI